MSVTDFGSFVSPMNVVLVVLFVVGYFLIRGMGSRRR